MHAWASHNPNFFQMPWSRKRARNNSWPQGREVEMHRSRCAQGFSRAGPTDVVSNVSGYLLRLPGSQFSEAPVDRMRNGAYFHGSTIRSVGRSQEVRPNPKKKYRRSVAVFAQLSSNPLPALMAYSSFSLSCLRVA